MWAELMHRLGYDRYGTQGGDFGACVVPMAPAQGGSTAATYICTGGVVTGLCGESAATAVSK